MRAAYVVHTDASDVALVAATAKTVVSYITASGGSAILTEASVSFDGTSPVAEAVTVEIVLGTEATSGTSTSQTPVQVRGATRTVQGSGKRNYSAEPTVLTVVRTFLIHPQAGIVYQLPLGREIEQIGSQDLIGIRCTAPAAVNCRAHMEVEE